MAIHMPCYTGLKQMPYDMRTKYQNDLFEKFVEEFTHKNERKRQEIIDYVDNKKGL